MSKPKIFRLQFDTPLHLSDVRDDYGKSEKRLHSDTLMAAIMQTWAVLGKAEWITNQPKFTVSSLFPFTSASQETVYFFPKPLLPFQIDGDANLYLKDLKNVEYLDWDFFIKVCKKEKVILNENAFKDKFLTEKNIEDDFIFSSIRSRIRKARRDSEDTEPYYVEQIHFKKGSGFWGLALFEDSETENRFKVALQFLQTSGLGTDRNIGNGQFNVEWENEAPFFENLFESDYAISLSLFCPENHQQLSEMLIDKEKCMYELIKRGGWISEPFNTYRKRSVMMFTEGSIFKTDLTPKGNTVNLQPNIIKQKIYRSGRALFFPVKQ